MRWILTFVRKTECEVVLVCEVRLVCEVVLMCEGAPLLRRSELGSESILLWRFDWNGL
ncbi:hypothetical protein [Pseudoalteromonas aurantia]|uniref:hypothetical protein n=1 Tax=Pseudoalteromonas aurantia TaxID=43654 RepID=UPI001485F01D|nr:hypothetical protein [Pseudoalteromonas aurantia]